MISKYFFIILTIFLLTTKPLFSQEINSGEMIVNNIFTLFEASLQCQAVAEITANYYIIYLGFKHSLEKSDIKKLETPKSISYLKTQFTKYEELIQEIKKLLTRLDSTTANKIKNYEQSTYIKIKQQLLYFLLNRIEPDFIENTMALNSECYQKFKFRQDYLKTISADIDRHIQENPSLKP